MANHVSRVIHMKDDKIHNYDKESYDYLDKYPNVHDTVVAI